MMAINKAKRILRKFENLDDSWVLWNRLDDKSLNLSIGDLRHFVTYVLEIERLQAENERLREALNLADVIAADLQFMMQFDACANDPRETWPNCDFEGCTYCAASYGMDAYKKARVLETDLPSVTKP